MERILKALESIAATQNEILKSIENLDDRVYDLESEYACDDETCECNTSEESEEEAFNSAMSQIASLLGLDLSDLMEEEENLNEEEQDMTEYNDLRELGLNDSQARDILKKKKELGAVGVMAIPMSSLLNQTTKPNQMQVGGQLLNQLLRK